MHGILLQNEEGADETITVGCDRELWATRLAPRMSELAHVSIGAVGAHRCHCVHYPHPSTGTAASGHI